MPKVPAGNLTGVYHIPIAGLPWSCSWQRLKDFARDQQPDGSFIDIDHVWVDGAGNGWVRVKGESNYKRALSQLNGGIIDHKSLIAFDRNDKDEVMLKDEVSSSSLHRRHRGSSSARELDLVEPTSCAINYHQMSHPTASYATSDAGTDMYYQPQHTSPLTPITPTFNPVYYPQPSPMYEQPNPFEYAMSAGPNIVYAGNMAPTTPIYIPSMPYVISYPYADNQLPPPLTSTHSIPSNQPTPTPTPQPQPQNLLIPTSARKIIITRLPHTTTDTELHSLLLKTITRHSTSSDPYAAIRSIDIQRHSDQKPRGHAFVVFESFEVTKIVVEKLDGYRWQGRELKVKFTKEGVEVESGGRKHPVVTVTEISSNRTGKGSVSSSERREGSENQRVRREREKGREGERKYQTKSCEPGRRRSSTPLVVDGSSHRR